jgi:transcriptional regulator with XRE-family HTH domain
VPTNAPASALAFGIASVLSDEKRVRGLSGQQIAELTGLTQTQVSRWLNAKVDISVQDLIALCDGLGMDFREFLASARRRAGEYELTTSVAESSSPDA